MPPHTFDYLLIGGGLQNALIALSVLKQNPDARVGLVERGAALGGNHLWCFHGFDLSEAGQALVAPLVVQRWDGYSVRFPSFERHLDTPYAAVSSERLAQYVAEVFADKPNSRLILGGSAVRVEASKAMLSNGEQLHARVVIDARGPEAHGRAHVIGYQKFVGLELELERPSELCEPMVMDASVRQYDGFRFVYTLPLSPSRVLVEDTYFADGPELDVDLLRTRALSYAHGLGLSVARIAREETGILPLPAAAAVMRSGSPFQAGYAGGWFHPTTGYSFPIAARLALHVASKTPETLFDERYDTLAREHARQQRYACLLNRLLFQAVPPDARRNVLERFYQLPEPSIARFYALSTTALDRARILCGRPPRGLSLGRALTKGLLQ
ncbi:MAG TPA: lycopene beta-cyclase CrtY [Polyangiaceae bacterium]|nr:lycopene beta-cyclase CrtY [Polyangiaceae bacterium]HYQ27459.1 lycopene beta-cyclase CrtY [Polyangiaceae bacterium]